MEPWGLITGTTENAEQSHTFASQGAGDSLKGG